MIKAISAKNEVSLCVVLYYLLAPFRLLANNQYFYIITIALCFGCDIMFSLVRKERLKMFESLLLTVYKNLLLWLWLWRLCVDY